MSHQEKREEGIIRPAKGRNDPCVGPDALMVMVPSELRFLAGKIGAERMPLSDMSVPYLYRSDGPLRRLVSISGPFLGAPQAVLAMEKLIALGARRFWVLGWCGSLQGFLRIGDAVVPTGAVSEEGTSRHYPIGEAPLQTDRALTARLLDSLGGQGLTLRTGVVWTTDAPYRETPEKVLRHQQAGVLAVEMEMSALMTVATFRSVAVTGMLVVSDELFELEWRTGFSNPRLREVTRSSAEILLQLAISEATQEANGERTN